MAFSEDDELVQGRGRQHPGFVDDQRRPTAEQVFGEWWPVGALPPVEELGDRVRWHAGVVFEDPCGCRGWCDPVHGPGDLVRAVITASGAPTGRPVYLMLDEVVYTPHWDLWLKTFFDDQWPLRIAATSSATAALRERRLESGIGRWSEQQLRFSRITGMSFVGVVGL